MKWGGLHKFQALSRSRSGTVSVEAAFITGIIVLITGAGIELSYGLWQWNATQQATRSAARIAAVSDPVAKELETMTGLTNDTESGDPMPAYSITCSGSSQSCTAGNFNNSEFNRLIFGPDNDGVCGPKSRPLSGMCDILKKITPDNVTVNYSNSGLGVAGSPANIRPIITLTTSGIDMDFVFLDLLTFNDFAQLPEISISVVGEDLKTSS